MPGRPSSHAAYLPLVPRPPHDPYSLVLDARALWRAHPAGAEVLGPAAVGQDGDGALALLPIPGSGRTFDEPSGSLGGLVLPRHLAPLGEGCDRGLILLDKRQRRLRRFDPCLCAFLDLPCLGPGDPRLPEGALAIATARGRLYIADPSGRQVVLLDARTGATRGLWRAPLHGPSAEDEPIADWQPAAIAAGPGCPQGRGIWVGDRQGGLVLRFSADGRLLERHQGFGAILALALDVQGRLLVLSEGLGLVHYDPRSREWLAAPLRPEELAPLLSPLPFEVRVDGSVNLGPWCSPPARLRVFDSSGEPVANPAPDPAPRYPSSGTWIGAALDSGIAECVWDRIQVGVQLPPRTGLLIETLTAETELDAETLRDSPHWRPALSLAGGPEGTGASAQSQAWTDPDFMLTAPPGRWLWLRLKLSGDGSATPKLSRIQIDFPRIGLTRYLPAVFVREPVSAEVLARFLAIFDRTFRSIETQIDTQARLFDPRSAPAGGASDFLGFLAGWVGISGIGALPLARRRELIREAPRAYAWRGTPFGILRTLYLALGIGPWSGYRAERAPCIPCPQSMARAIPERFRWRAPRLLLEHFALRDWLWLGVGRLSGNARLWGERIVNRSRLGAGGTGSGTPGCATPGLKLGGPGCVGPADARAADPGGRDETARLGVTQLKTSQDPYRDPFHVHAHRLSVFVPAACLSSAGMARALEMLLRAEVPGHVQWDLIPVEPRFRIGVQSMLGLDAVIGYRAAPVRLADQGCGPGSGPGLGRATVLAEGPKGKTGTGEGGARHLRVGTRRIGMDTTLQ